MRTFTEETGTGPVQSTRRKLFTGILVTAALLSTSALSGTAVAQQEPEQEAQTADRPSRAVQAYAEAYTVSVEEAQRRLTANRGVGDLGAQIEAAEGETFGGLYIEHTPVHRVVVKFTRGGEATLRRYTQDPKFVVLPTQVSLRQLTEAQQSLTSTLRTLGIDNVSRLNIETSRVELYVADPAVVQRLRTLGTLRLPDFVDINRALDLSRHGEQAQRIEGGRRVEGPRGSCTTGFTVFNTRTPAQRFISTAGHCFDPITYNGVTIPLVGRNWVANTTNDYQWHSIPAGFAQPTNVIYEGLTQPYPIRATRAYSVQAIGEWVCKYGNFSGYTCGRIVSKTYNLQGSPGFVQVAHPSKQQMSVPGDSGGPYYDDWTYPNTAFGTHSDSARAVDPRDSVYMPINNFANSSLSVLTTP